MAKTGKHHDNYLKSLGSRILCELNDLKRTPETAASELGYSVSDVTSIINGESSEEEGLSFINKMGHAYPIDHFQVSLLKDDTTSGVKFMSATDSKKSRRVYSRLNKEGQKTRYYEYRDTAMSKLALFKPEWIAVLREVNDSNPLNPNVVMNNGHFMHQVTLFVGPVNFYYEDSNGQVHCREMNTGDSNYITPFVKHSFTSRDKNSFTCILAVTYGDDVSRAQRSLYAMGKEVLESYVLDYKKHHNATRQLIKQCMKNDFMTEENLDQLLKKQNKNIDIKEIFSTSRKLTLDEYEALASCLNIEISDIMIPEYKHGDECIVKRYSDASPYEHNEERYKIFPLARATEISSVRSSIIEVASQEHNMNFCLQRSLHTYIINFNNSPVEIMWDYEGKTFSKILEINDSVYLKPFIKFSLANKGASKGQVFVVGISTAVDTRTQKELSTFIQPKRVINELETWYDN